MKCPVIDYHKNRSLKWWLKYATGWIIAIVTYGMFQWDDIDGFVNGKKSERSGNK